jgi:hypothetical protein
LVALGALADRATERDEFLVHPQAAAILGSQGGETALDLQRPQGLGQDVASRRRQPGPGPRSATPAGAWITISASLDDDLVQRRTLGQIGREMSVEPTTSGET